MKKILVTIVLTAGFVVPQSTACPTCIGTMHKENTPAFFSRDFYQPGATNTQHQSNMTHKPAQPISPKPMPKNHPPVSQADQEEQEQAESMAAVMESSN